MRIDQILNKLCLVKTRSIVKKACDLNLVKINSRIAKASNKVQTNDIIEYNLNSYFTKIKLLEIPQGNVSKSSAPKFYELIERERIIDN
ncbi:MAG: RNA-binding protein [Candidatus Cloacimonetes bacterium]|nr:RNA-binding protein [Candidatus Cloacimonadota bacterium]